MKKKKGFTLIELLAVIVVLAIIMIIAIPNILGTMNTSKTSAFKVQAQKMFNEAAKKYEEEGLSGITIGNQNTNNGELSAFYQSGEAYNIGISSVLASSQNKYKGCIVITPQTSGNVPYIMSIYMTDGEFYYEGKTESAIKSDNPTAGSKTSFTECSQQ